MSSAELFQSNCFLTPYYSIGNPGIEFVSTLSKRERTSFAVAGAGWRGKDSYLAGIVLCFASVGGISGNLITVS